MSSRPFVHLHCHSHYSLLDGASKVPNLVKRAKALGMPALAITDHGNLHGAVEFLREAKAADFKPILGMEAYVAPFHRTDKTLGGNSGREHNFHLTLLAENGEGFRNLLRLSSMAFLEGYYRKPRIDKEILQRHSKGLICLSGCVSSEFSDHILFNKFAEAEKLAVWYQEVFGPENFFIEVQNNGVQIQKDHEQAATDFARRLGLPMVATSDAHYLMQEDHEVHDILLCINTGTTVDDPKRMKFEADQFHVRSPEEMYRAMPGHEEALANTVRIAERVEEHYKSFNLGKRQFPSFQPPENKTPEDYLRELCVAGLKDRYGDSPSQAALDRMEHELGIINRMGFASYFLIVWDFVRYAREQGIPNSARGSACGALVSYLLYLSHVDPLTYDLLFERFLDPNRSEAPDIDIDLCKERRGEVIAYVKRKYGEANVAQIGTFGTMAAKASLKDVGRALNLPFATVESVTKLIPVRPNISLEDAFAEEPQIKRLIESDPDIRRMWDYALRLEGTARNVGTHAAGVVIADRPLRDMVPLQIDSKNPEVVRTQWEMGDVEKAGLLKMDFLGLRNLTSLDAAIRMIEARHPGKLPADLNKLPLDDEATYATLQRGEAKGIFQLDGSGIRDLLVKMRADRFADIIAILALYRPGPLNGGMVDEYVDVKRGRKHAEYAHPVLKEILEETYGVMVYQEQVMRILNRLGGIELSQAYACIKAISKKKMETIAAGRKAFCDGAASRGLDRKKAEEIFGLIEFFGGYGFNKSHTCAYALVAYQTAWLKTHYPAEFMAALLSSEMDGAERDKFFVDHIDDCRRMKLELRPPNINVGECEFSVSADNVIEFGLGAIKGIGTRAVEAIVRERQANGPFRDLGHFFERVSTSDVSQGNVETLIRAGAFDCFGAKRSQLIAILPRAVQGGQAMQKVLKDTAQKHMFGTWDSDPATTVPEAQAAIPLPEIDEFPDVQRLADEKKALGFYMSSHPLTNHAEELKAFSTHQVADLANVAEKAEITLGGLVVGLTVRNVKQSRDGGTRMAKLNFEDLSGSTPAMMWPSEYCKFEHILKDDFIGFVRGTLNRQRDPAEFMISKVIPLDKAPAELARGLLVRLQKGTIQPSDIDRLLRMVRNYPGNLDLYFTVSGIAENQRAIFKAGANLKVRHDDQLLHDVRLAIGSDNVRIIGHRGTVASASAKPHLRPAGPGPSAYSGRYDGRAMDNDLG